MNCTKCCKFKEFLHGPYPTAGDVTAPIMIISQNPPANKDLARKGAFRLFERNVTPSRVEKPIHNLVAKLGMPIFATASFKCATVHNEASRRMLRNCKEHLMADFKSTKAPIVLIVSALAWHDLRPKILDLVELKRLPLLTSKGKVPLSIALYHGTIEGHIRRFLVAPHPSLIVRFFSQEEWERLIIQLITEKVN